MKNPKHFQNKFKWLQFSVYWQDWCHSVPYMYVVKPLFVRKLWHKSACDINHCWVIDVNGRVCVTVMVWVHVVFHAAVPGQEEQCGFSGDGSKYKAPGVRDSPRPKQTQTHCQRSPHRQGWFGESVCVGEWVGVVRTCRFVWLYAFWTCLFLNLSVRVCVSVCISVCVCVHSLCVCVCLYLSTDYIFIRSSVTETERAG